MKLVCEECGYIIRYYAPFDDEGKVYTICPICRRKKTPLRKNGETEERKNTDNPIREPRKDFNRGFGGQSR